MADREFLSKITRAIGISVKRPKIWLRASEATVHSKTVNYDRHFYATELSKRFDLKKFC